MASKISPTLFLVFLVSSISQGKDCNPWAVLFSIGNYHECVRHQKVKLDLIDHMDIEETCSTVPAALKKCMNDNFKNPPENCENEVKRAMLVELEEDPERPINFLCYDNGRYLKELKENEGMQCYRGLMEAIQKNCQQSKETTCPEALEKLKCAKKIFPDTCKENVKKIIYTTLKYYEMASSCNKQLLREIGTDLDDDTDLEIKLSTAVKASGVMTKSNFVHMIIMTLFLTVIML